eukprot:CAMPEP_0170190716 /NCGR_PEP_ID=MMETSP0040_2-20121228/49969_1 /TAXON_ID=641309 /ORGANISM="Lotharella oceanica, Strain CCMP622" /LENGTH=137 /DNA_ID=CAMNT_0010438647 /DNA_START=157 /DNA_END=570 /DNA_ORIENTATION=-
MDVMVSALGNHRALTCHSPTHSHSRGVSSLVGETVEKVGRHERIDDLAAHLAEGAELLEEEERENRLGREGTPLGRALGADADVDILREISNKLGGVRGMELFQNSDDPDHQRASIDAIPSGVFPDQCTNPLVPFHL